MTSPYAQQIYAALQKTLAEEGLDSRPHVIKALMDTIHDALGSGAIWEATCEDDDITAGEFREVIEEAFDYKRAVLRSAVTK